MRLKAYKQVLDKMPVGVFVFDKRLRILFANAAFARAFKQRKKRSSLKETLACEEQSACGEGANCAYCNFYRLMTKAVKEGAEQSDVASVSVRRATHTDNLSLKIRILPLDEKSGLFLGLTEGEYRSELAREMLSAQKIQRRLLPAGKSMGGVPYSYMYIPCLDIGGDLPDVYELNGKTYALLADVSGKGISAGMLSAFVKAGYDKTEPSIAAALSSLGVRFRELNLDERSYITAAAVCIDKAAGTVRYSLAGHNAPILLKHGQGIDEIEFPAPPISDWLPEFTYGEREIPFKAGDLLALVTDGVTECRNSAGELFGIERTESVLLQSKNAEDFIGKLKTALSVFSGGVFSDDITAVAFDL